MNEYIQVCNGRLWKDNSPKVALSGLVSFTQEQIQKLSTLPIEELYQSKKTGESVLGVKVRAAVLPVSDQKDTYSLLVTAKQEEHDEDAIVTDELPF